MCFVFLISTSEPCCNWSTRYTLTSKCGSAAPPTQGTSAPCSGGIQQWPWLSRFDMRVWICWVVWGAIFKEGQPVQQNNWEGLLERCSRTPYQPWPWTKAWQHNGYCASHQVVLKACDFLLIYVRVRDAPKHQFCSFCWTLFSASFPRKYICQNYVNFSLTSKQIYTSRVSLCHF